jgi:DivIVA domain-containing protein
MDVTPQELRSSEIKDSWRGYDRDEVDDLLERAAVTIESLTQQVQEVQSRPAPVAAPAAAPAEVPLPSSREDADMLQRTLLMAQRAADDAVNDAQSRAKQLLEESESKAQALVSDAEATARRIAEGERRRLEAELLDLSARREQLRADADALDEYVSSYRERIRSAIEQDLANLGGQVDAPSARPELHEVEIPVEQEPAPAPAPVAVAAEPAPAPAPAVDLTREPEPASPSGEESAWDPGPATRAISGLDTDAHETGPLAAEASATRSPVAAPPRPEPAPEWPPPAPAPAAEAPAAPAAASDSSWLTSSDAEWESSTAAWDSPAPWERDPAPPATFSSDVPMEANAVDTDSLDDDAFFASLREAVRDDAPLGPREDEQAAFFDSGDQQDRRRFRRRR